ncbi:putative aaa family atpase protein [Eutypa lata UCREL1]|uniref:Putative aaa family atpase protein n=1 Tax=Eutypa lata (strain UCR-EL1) TaxID=1287681 RepID=M7TZG9_EUTLA|nr:putative aaa family atpase protein [Eutypa lata UCREL1]
MEVTEFLECVAEYFKKPLFQITCVFLRILEYYNGVLFLTTNRVGDFDEAFTSRIHMSLYYPPLDLDSTKAIFGLNIGRIKKQYMNKGINLQVQEVPIGVFVIDFYRSNPRARWNGRQIRNACQTALALAEFEAQGESYEETEDPDAVVNLEVKHLEMVAHSYLGFMHYLKDIYGVDADERAKENFLRATPRESQPSSYGGEPAVRQCPDDNTVKRGTTVPRNLRYNESRNWKKQDRNLSYIAGQRVSASHQLE